MDSTASFPPLGWSRTLESLSGTQLYDAHQATRELLLVHWNRGWDNPDRLGCYKVYFVEMTADLVAGVSLSACVKAFVMNFRGPLL